MSLLCHFHCTLTRHGSRFCLSETALGVSKQQEMSSVFGTVLSSCRGFAGSCGSAEVFSVFDHSCVSSVFSRAVWTRSYDWLCATAGVWDMSLPMISLTSSSVMSWRPMERKVGSLSSGSCLMSGLSPSEGYWPWGLIG